MTAIEDVRKVADAVVSIFRNANDCWRDLSGAARIERCELLWDSHLTQDFKDRSIAETVHIPVPRFQQFLWAVIKGRHAGGNRRDKPLPAMEKINESPPVHNIILTPRGKSEDSRSPVLRIRTCVRPVRARVSRSEKGVRPVFPSFPVTVHSSPLIA